MIKIGNMKKEIEKLIKDNLRDPLYVLSDKEIIQMSKDIKSHEEMINKRSEISNKDLEKIINYE